MRPYPAWSHAPVSTAGADGPPAYERFGGRDHHRGREHRRTSATAGAVPPKNAVCTAPSSRTSAARSIRDHRSLIHRRDLVAQLEDGTQVVFDQQHRARPRLAQPSQGLDHAIDFLAGESRERLVEQQERSPGGERSTDLDSLAFAAREVAHRDVESTLETQRRQ